ncbi:patatin-like phospholipase family protein [Tranquillimonas alkanivorans]|uniref:Patatin-like phospholipase n=1 Tax=Tranquillimonas alkanivorans TaxID=441119 RepID=A0A1I5KVJ8_9RHOB|nr:patatin-like phospholipase family protein [Tranquillimonas alkanivorans]SFO89027.1 Patatin-like phospholipase [Tranquillimonas alkanivorans]
MSDTQISPFEQIVFSGGGTRCFWQGGFMEVFCDKVPIAPARVAGVSGGALAGACYLAGRERRLLEVMQDAFRDQDSNVNWHVREDGGLTPHQRLYREVVETVLDADAQKHVAAGPHFQILLAHPPLSLMPKLGGMISTLLYEAELHTLSRPDGQWPGRMGLGHSLVDARAVAAEGRLAELVIAAATIPPIFDLPLWNDRPVIDGGMFSQVPTPEPDEGRTLVLLTRRYDRLPGDERCTFVEPSDEVPADKIDFTDPGKIRRTWDQGEEDARAFLKAHPDL